MQSVPTNHGLNLSVISAVRLRGVVDSLSVKGVVYTPTSDTCISELFLHLQARDVVFLIIEQPKADIHRRTSHDDN